MGDIAIVGLAVMGQNLALNMAEHGFTVVVYNRTAEKVDTFIAGLPDDVSNIIGVRSVDEMVQKLSRPRKIMLMVKAGDAVDSFIEKIIPYLEDGDCIIDGGNSHYADTTRRMNLLTDKGILYLGTGISGGEYGARNGPSIMPGGNKDAWTLVKQIFQTISAKTDSNTPCCDWIGKDGAGHFVKMVHNGIEYGDMQIICEAYHLLRELGGFSSLEIGNIFKEWNRKELNSYLIEITAEILVYKDNNGLPLIDSILDVAGQKGTGKWTGISSLELGMPVTLIAESVYARSLSVLKNERIRAANILGEPKRQKVDDPKLLVENVRKALLASKIISYTQGFMLIQAASEHFNWEIDLSSVALIWRGGCIIRSNFLDNISNAFLTNGSKDPLILNKWFKNIILNCDSGWRSTITTAIINAIPTPAFSSALSFYDGLRSKELPTNLLQAQRDYFGAHTYERVDQPRGKFFHTNWTESISTTESKCEPQKPVEY